MWDGSLHDGAWQRTGREGRGRTGTLDAAPKVQLFERNRGNAGNNARELQGLENNE